MPFAIAHPIQGKTPVVLTPAHGIFDQLVVAEAAMAGYLHGHSRAAGAVGPPSGHIMHVCFVEQAEIDCHVSPILHAITNESWPASVSLGVHAMPQAASAVRTATPNSIQRLMGSIHAQAFLTYYENVKAKIEARYGSVSSWPEALKFARMTRNAFGHGGKLNITKATDTATWRGLTLTYANHGDQMLYNHITSGDVILLMLDMDDLL